MRTGDRDARITGKGEDDRMPTADLACRIGDGYDASCCAFTVIHQQDGLGAGLRTVVASRSTGFEGLVGAVRVADPLVMGYTQHSQAPPLRQLTQYVFFIAVVAGASYAAET